MSHHFKPSTFTFKAALRLYLSFACLALTASLFSLFSSSTIDALIPGRMTCLATALPP